MFQQFEKQAVEKGARKRKAMSLGTAVAVYVAIGLVAVYAVTGAVPKKPKKSLEVSFARHAAEKVERVKPKAKPKPRPKVTQRLRKRAGKAAKRAALAPPKEIPTEAPREADPANLKVASITQDDLDERGVVGGKGEAGEGGDGTGLEIERPRLAPTQVVAPKVAVLPPIYLPENATPPKPLESNPVPRFPRDRLKAGVGDTVVMKVVVTEAGQVQVLKVIRGKPDFVASVLEVLPRWRFQPAVFEGERLRVYKILEVPFRIRG